jgi:naphthoate synthase
MSTEYEDITYEIVDSAAWVTIDREDDGNRFRRQTTLELLDALSAARVDRSVRSVVLTGAGDRFFCIGGVKEDIETLDYSSVLPIVDVYEMIDTIGKPVIAAVNGFAVGGGTVLHVVCDLSIASDRAVFRQVGPMVGSFDAGYGTWYLEDVVGRKRAKELWYLNEKYDAEAALAMGLVNRVVPHERLHEEVRAICATIADRGPQALAGLKAAFTGRHAGVAGMARISHDLLLTHYLRTDEAAELGASFAERRPPDQSRFNT